MSAARHPRIPPAASMIAAAILLSGIAGWVGIALLLAAGPVGLAVLAGLILGPGTILALQFATMTPAARRPSARPCRCVRRPAPDRAAKPAARA